MRFDNDGSAVYAGRCKTSESVSEEVGSGIVVGQLFAWCKLHP